MNEEVTRFEHDIRLSGTLGFDSTVIVSFGKLATYIDRVRLNHQTLKTL